MSRLAAALCLVLLVASCAHHGVEEHNGVVEPNGGDFFAQPDRYQSRVVRLVGLGAMRIDVSRPLLFMLPGDRSYELAVNDGRSLARSQGIVPGDTVTILIDCTEGRLDRGNLLLAIDHRVGSSALPGH